MHEEMRMRKKGGIVVERVMIMIEKKANLEETDMEEEMEII